MSTSPHVVRLRVVAIYGLSLFEKKYERLFIISSLKLLKMFDDKNTGFATGSTLIRRLDEVATQPKVTIGTIGNYRGLLENTRELLLTTWEVFRTIGTYWEV